MGVVSALRGATMIRVPRKPRSNTGRPFACDGDDTPVASEGQAFLARARSVMRGFEPYFRYPN